MSVASDGIYLAGDTYSFGAGDGDAFIVKYDGSGTQLWNRTWGGAEWDYGQAIAVDAEGVYLGGLTTSGGNSDGFLAKYGHNGTLLWSRTWGGAEFELAQGVAIGTDGVYLAGQTNSFGMQTRAFLVKYAANGTWIWDRTWLSGSESYAASVAASTDGVYIAGGRYNFSAGGNEAIIVKYDATGNQLWNRTWGGSNDDFGFGVTTSTYAVDGLYLTGRTTSFGAGDNDAFLVKYNASGSQLWNCTRGGTGFDNGNNVDEVLMYDPIYECTIKQIYWATSKNLYLFNSTGSELWHAPAGAGWVAIGNLGLFSASTTTGGTGGNDARLTRLVPNYLPSITHPADIVYETGTSGRCISWLVTDLSIGQTNYTVLRNGMRTNNGTWTSGSPIIEDIGGLAAGTYNYTIVAADGVGGLVRDTVIVTITAQIAINGFPIAIILGCAAFGLVFIVIDRHRKSIL